MGNLPSQQPAVNLDQSFMDFPPDESFQNIPSVLLKDLRRKKYMGKKVLEHIDIPVYALLKSHSRMKGSCHPSLSRLAALSACSVATIQRSLKRLDDAGHIQRKSHNKGKIFLLTDVSEKGQILRKNRIVFNAPPRPACSVMPPKVQDVSTETTPITLDTENAILPEDEMPF